MADYITTHYGSVLFGLIRLMAAPFINQPLNPIKLQFFVLGDDSEWGIETTRGTNLDLAVPNFTCLFSRHMGAFRLNAAITQCLPARAGAPCTVLHLSLVHSHHTGGGTEYRAGMAG